MGFPISRGKWTCFFPLMVPTGCVGSLFPLPTHSRLRMDLGRTIGRALRTAHVTLPFVGILGVVITLGVYISVLTMGPLVIPLAGLIALSLAYVMFWKPERSRP